MIRAVMICIFVLIASLGFAKDGPQWGHDPETSEWFRSLHNDSGMSCCDYADGVRIEDPNWFEIGGGEYAVFARGKWQAVPPDRVLKAATGSDMRSCGGRHRQNCRRAFCRADEVDFSPKRVNLYSPLRPAESTARAEMEAFDGPSSEASPVSPEVI